MAFYQLDPWGGARGDLQTGIVASSVYNAAGGKTRPADFVPDFLRRSGDDARSLKAVARAFAAARGTVKGES